MITFMKEKADFQGLVLHLKCTITVQNKQIDALLQCKFAIFASQIQYSMEKLQEHFEKLLRETNTSFHRYLYSKINWNSRMIGLTGPRGVGKTTLVLQHIKEELDRNKALYVTAEDFYLSLIHI